MWVSGYFLSVPPQVTFSHFASIFTTFYEYDDGGHAQSIKQLWQLWWACNRVQYSRVGVDCDAQVIEHSICRRGHESFN